MKKCVCATFLISLSLFCIGNCALKSLSKDFKAPQGVYSPLCVSSDSVYSKPYTTSKQIVKSDLSQQEVIWSKTFGAYNSVFSLGDNKLLVYFYNGDKYEFTVVNSENATISVSNYVSLNNIPKVDSLFWDSGNNLVWFNDSSHNIFKVYTFNTLSGEIKNVYTKEFDESFIKNQNHNYVFVTNSVAIGDGKFFVSFLTAKENSHDKPSKLYFGVIDSVTGETRVLATDFEYVSVKFTKLNDSLILIQSPNPYQKIALYNTENNKLSYINVPEADKNDIDYSSAILLDNEHILFSGGFSYNKPVNKLRGYNLKTNEFITLKTKLRHARYQHFSKVYKGNQILFYGGFTENINKYSEFDLSPITLAAIVLSGKNPCVFAESVLLDKILDNFN